MTHTAEAVALYRRAETALLTMLRMLEQTPVQRADQFTITTLENVAKKLERTEDAWAKARQIAEAAR